MKILIACEFSGIVRETFRAKGHDAYSIDLLPTETPGAHIQGYIQDFLNPVWDMMIAFPPCTYLACSGARWHSNSPEQYNALAFVQMLLNAPIPKIALENPVGAINSQLRKPNQIIQPWQFGHGETKKTCLWLKELPCLIPTDIVSGRVCRVYRSSSKNRWKNRSRTLIGIAQAMAQQWG